MSDVAPDTPPEGGDDLDISPVGEVAPDAETMTYRAADIRKLREEAAKWRTQYRTYEEAFDGYAPEEVDWWRRVARQVASDPKTGAEELLRVAQALIGGDNAMAEPEPDKTAEPAASPADQPKYLTSDDLQRVLSERDETAKREKMIADLHAEAKALGYEQGTPEHSLLMNYAAQNQGDLKKAHEAVQNWQKAVFDRMVTERRQAADRFPRQTSGGAAVGPPAKEFKTFAEASAALRERLRADPFG